MAINEPGSSSGGVTDLLSGWSFVVHRPSEDPEPSSLPSTVDITAFSAGPTEHQVNQSASSQQCSGSSDSESDTDVSKHNFPIIFFCLRFRNFVKVNVTIIKTYPIHLRS